MNERLYISTDTSAPLEPIEELSRVTLLRDASTDDETIVPSGSTGTILSVYRGGEAYCVEFTSPVQAEIILENDAIRLIEGEDRGAHHCSFHENCVLMSPNLRIIF